MKINYTLLNHVMVIPYLAFSLILSRLILRAGGDSHPLMSGIIAFSVVIIILTSSKRRFYFLAVPFLLIMSLYAPIGFTYGAPKYQYVASLFATNFNESKEFFSTIEKKHFLYSLAIPFFGVLLYVMARLFKIKPINNSFFSICVVLFLFYLSGAFPFYREAAGALKSTIDEVRKLSLYVNNNEWENVRLSDESRYDDYFIVIGESARKDYFHSYGYPIKNTPFLDSTNGVVVSGLTAGGFYTIGSLRMMLTQGNKNSWEPNYSLNIIGLANKAGMETFWISNQGQFGQYDTPVSAIAKQAKYNYFTKSSSYGSKVVSDFSLLNKLQDYLPESKNGKKRLFVIHTMGSHPSACDRVRDDSDMKYRFFAAEKKYSYVACYISSIKKTDAFLSELNLLLSKSDVGRKFSIIYFSDHGLAHRDIDGVIQINNNLLSKYHYDIPLVKISSDDTSRSEVSSEKSGLMFLNGLASWMGIKSDQIQNYDLFDGVDDVDDYGLSKKIDGATVNDPAIPINIIK